MPQHGAPMDSQAEAEGHVTAELPVNIPPKAESFFSTFSDLHSGHGYDSSVAFGTSFSKDLPQDLQKYSKIGIINSSFFFKMYDIIKHASG